MGGWNSETRNVGKSSGLETQRIPNILLQRIPSSKSSDEATYKIDILFENDYYLNEPGSILSGGETPYSHIRNTE